VVFFFFCFFGKADRGTRHLLLFVHTAKGWADLLLEGLLLSLDLGLVGRLVRLGKDEGLSKGLGEGVDIAVVLEEHLGVVQLVLDLVDVVLEGVAGGGALTVLAVLLLELLGIGEHARDVGRREAGRVVLDGDVVLAVGGTVLSGDVENTVGVEVKGHLELGGLAGCRGDAGELKAAEEVVVLAHGALTLIDGELDSGLAVLGGGEDLLLDGRDGGVAGDNNREDATLHLDTEREGDDVEQEEVLSLLVLLAHDDGGLDGGTVGDGLVGVDRAVERLALEELL